jgi:uncharacterized protein with HEPN domain
MLPRNVRKYLFDIQEACQQLADFTAGKSFTEYASDALLQSAVERQFEIIGEALRQAIDCDPSVATAISDTGKIIAFRNRLIHGYASVSSEVVWGILERNLPVLRQEVAFLLTSCEDH